MTYKWHHKPIKMTEDLFDYMGENGYFFKYKPKDIPEEDLGMWDEEYLKNYDDNTDAGLMEHYGFYYSPQLDGQFDRDSITDPWPNSLTVVFSENECYGPIGQHGSYSMRWLTSEEEGPWLISYEDYMEISKGIYTPATYILPVIKENDPYQAAKELLEDWAYSDAHFIEVELREKVHPAG